MRRQGGWGLAVLALLVALSGCGSAGVGLATGNPTSYLITVDQLVAPDFTVSSAATHVTASTLAGGDAALAAALGNDGLQTAASVEYQRAADFSTANGPLDVVATAMQFASVAGATSAYGTGIRQLDAMPGATPTSTGPLGDEAHAISVVKTTTGGLSAVEITLEWRVGNIVNILITRGRYGGTRLDDALVLANLQTANETGSNAS
jgi:hypothetical protein